MQALVLGCCYRLSRAAALPKSCCGGRARIRTGPPPQRGGRTAARPPAPAGAEPPNVRYQDMLIFIYLDIFIVIHALECEVVPGGWSGRLRRRQNVAVPNLGEESSGPGGGVRGNGTREVLRSRSQAVKLRAPMECVSPSGYKKGGTSTTCRDQEPLVSAVAHGVPACQQEL